MRRNLMLLAAVIAPIALAACGDSTGVNQVLSNENVSMQDQCDSASFNAALGPGTCVRAGGVTFSQFNAELAANQFVAAWQFVPATMTLRVGQAIQAMNNGGEMHTFTHVNQFGGGMVPSLNTASGNPVEAPECAQLPANALLAPGASVTTPAAVSTGIGYYQCCIHPWMRTTVTVTGP